MSSTYARTYFQTMDKALASLQVSDVTGKPVDSEAGFELWCDWTRELAAAGTTMYFVGNGASAMMSSHMAVDGSKNAGFRAQALNDVAFLTAIGNDLGYDQAFSFPLKRFGRAGDLLVTISSSGNSPNVIKAIETARELGMKVVTLSGMKPGNRSRALGDLNLYIPANTYGVVECAHQVLLHCWLDKYMGIVEG